MNFGDLIEGSDAAGLVQAVRQSRLADIASTRTPTFGEVADENRMAQQTAAAEQAAAPAGPSEQDVLSQVKMIVDVRSGTFKPVLPGEPDPGVGPTEVAVSFEGGQPNIIATGKRVRDVDLAKLSDPKRGMQPKLAPDYQVPAQYEGLAKALGIEQGEGEGPDAEAAVASPKPETEEKV